MMIHRRIPSPILGVFSWAALGFCAKLLVPAALPAAVIAAPSAQPATQQQRQEEEEDYYKKWLDETVVYIISDEERAVFEALSTAEEKDAFIEQFWLRRDPDPLTSINEFREEHFRRLAYANEHFSSGTPGWKSDRGRIYIIQGEPDSVEYHDQGEQYYRPSTEGGGVTSTFSWVVWYYRHLEGIDDDVYIEFVDKTMSGNYVLARDEMDKDATLWVPGLGLTEAERLGGATKAERIGTRTMANMASRRIGNPLKMFTQKDDLFARLRRYTMLQASPEIEYKDLERMVDTHIYYNQLPFSIRHDVLRITTTDYLVPVTFFFNTPEFNFSRVGQVDRAKVEVYGRVEDLTGHRIYAFDDEVVLDRQKGQGAFTPQSVYQRNLPLKAGRYKFVAVVRDGDQGKVGTLEQGIVIPPDESVELQLSDVILADQVRPAAGAEFITDPFVLGGVKVYPSPDNAFSRGEPLGFYFEVYNVAADQQTLEPSLALDLKIARGSQEIPLPFSNLERLLHRYSDRFFAGSMLNTTPLEPGRYTLTVSVRDQIAQQTVEKKVRFEIL